MESKSADELPITNRFGLDFYKVETRLERYSLNFMIVLYYDQII